MLGWCLSSTEDQLHLSISPCSVDNLSHHMNISCKYFPSHHNYGRQLVPQAKRKGHRLHSGGFSLASTVFSPLQSLPVNPANLPPSSSNLTNTTEEMSSSSYFTDPELLTNVPLLLLYMAALYAVILSIGVLLLAF